MSNEIKLGNDIFTVAPLPAMRSFALQPRIVPALAEVIGAIGGLSNLDTTDVAAIVPLVSRFFAALGAGELEAITRELLQTATMNNQLLFSAQGNAFDLVMRGRTLDTWRLLWHAIRINYPDFFGLLGASGGAGKAASRSVESTT